MSTETRTPEDVQRVLDTFDLGLRVIHYEETTATSEDAASAIGCELGQIAKSMCLMVGGSPALLVGSGDQKISEAKLARHFGIGRKKIKLAKSDECIEIFGYPPGGVSPVGHRTSGIPIVLDELLRRYEIVYTAAGTPNDNFEVTVDQLQKITDGTFIDCMKE